MSAGIGKRRHLTEAGFVVMWSSGFIGASLGTPEASTPTLMVWRFLLAAGLLLVGILLLRRRWPGLREIAVQGVVGLLAQGVYLMGVVGAVEFGVTAGTTALIAALQPLLAAALAGPVLGERVDRQQWAGLAVGLVGVALVVGGDVRVAEAPLWAYAMPFAGMAGLVAATLVERREYLRGSGLETPMDVVLAIQCTASALLFAALAPFWGGLDPAGWVTLLGCCRLVRRVLHLRGLRLLLAEPEVEQRGQGEQPHLPNTTDHHGLGLPYVRRACWSARCCGARDLLRRRPVGERLACGYQNVLMSPILMKERGRPSDCSAGCPVLGGWLD
jgi:drug/metabolite transporter (DMT)-like permease